MPDVMISLGKTVQNVVSRILSDRLLLAWVVFFVLWNVISTGSFSFSSLVFFGVLYFLCRETGIFFLQRTLGSSACDTPLPSQLVIGYLLINTLLYIFILMLPFGVVIDVFIILVLLMPIIIKQTVDVSIKKVQMPIQDILVFFISFVAASFWFRDALVPTRFESENIIFQFWSDGFFHARQISAFAFSHGWSSISDITLAGVSPQLYHFAMYSIPAALSIFTETRSLEVFSSFLLPMGFVLTVFAAYSLLAKLFGRWSALAGCVALAVLPDAFQQGFGSNWLSYNWLQQIAPGGMYGVALMALAWFFMFDGCRRGEAKSILVSYFLAVLTIVYKAHIFIANSYLIFVYPFLFFPKIKAWQKLVLVASSSSLYFTVAYVSQFSQSVPLLRLNGSSFTSYVGGVVQGFERGPIGRFFMTVLTDQPSVIPSDVFWAVVMLLIATFGIFFPILMFAIKKLSKRQPFFVWAFPVFVIIVYLAMSLGLEYDSRKIGTSEELLHRPFVWAYFIVCSWSIAGISHVFIGFFRRNKSVFTKKRIFALLAAISVFPVFFSHEIQTMPQWSSTKEYPRVPGCLVSSAEYIRIHSPRSAVLQDSGQGSLFNESSHREGLVLTSLSERQAFAINVNGTRQPKAATIRFKDMDRLRQATQNEEIVRLMKVSDISWYVLRPEDAVQWPNALLDAPVYQCNGYRVYRF